jgi:hypothetical protein
MDIDELEDVMTRQECEQILAEEHGETEEEL